MFLELRQPGPYSKSQPNSTTFGGLIDILSSAEERNGEIQGSKSTFETVDEEGSKDIMESKSVLAAALSKHAEKIPHLH